MALFLQSEIEKASKLGFTEGAKGLPASDAKDPDLNESMFYAKAVSQLNKTGETITPKITAQENVLQRWEVNWSQFEQL